MNKQTVAGPIQVIAILILMSQTVQPLLAAKNNKVSTAPTTTYTQIGYLDTKGKLVVKSPKRVTSYSFSEGLAVVTEGESSYMDHSGKIAIHRGFTYAEPFSEGLASAGEFGRWGFIDTTGAFKISPIFETARSFKEGMAAVNINDRWGYVDKFGKLVIPVLFENAVGFSEGLAAVQTGGKIGFVGKDGKWKLEPQFDQVEGFSGGLALVSISSPSGQKRFYIDHDGKHVLEFDPVHNTPNNTIKDISEIGMVVQKDKWGGNILESVSKFSEGLAAFPLDGKYGYIEKTGRFVIPPQFDSAEPFSEGVALVRLSGKCGFIDKTGKVIIASRYTEAWGFSNGLAAVAERESHWGYIDKNGKFVVAPKYRSALPFSDGLGRVEYEVRELLRNTGK